jgi:hypothetical protein
MQQMQAQAAAQQMQQQLGMVPPQLAQVRELLL